MTRGFWDSLPRPFFALAPMANVTDAAFRRIIAKYGKPDVMWTEFVSGTGLCSPGREILLNDLVFTKNERPIVAQIFGSNPDHFTRAAGLIKELGFDGIDINMGCPDRAVEKQGGGAVLIKNPTRAQELIRAARAGAPELPISVKTRIGYSRDTLEEWLAALVEAEPAAITIHARTRKEMSLVPAHWDAVARAVRLVKKVPASRRPLVIGNGDVATLAEAHARARETGADGIMIGRGIFGNPWLFNRKRGARPPTLAKKLSVMVEHTKLFEKLFSGVKSFDVMKKHYKAYVSGFPGAKELRIELMGARTAKEVERVLSRFSN